MDLSVDWVIPSGSAFYLDIMQPVRENAANNIRGLLLKTLLECPLSDEGWRRTKRFSAWHGMKRWCVKETVSDASQASGVDVEHWVSVAYDKLASLKRFLNLFWRFPISNEADVQDLDSVF